MSDDDAVTVEILYVRNSHARDADPIEPGDDYYELVRDLGGFAVGALARNNVGPAEALEGAFASLGEPVEIDLNRYDFDAEDTRKILGHIYSRLQGGRDDDELPYDGTEHRSARVGDVLVIDGEHYMIGHGHDYHWLDLNE